MCPCQNGAAQPADNSEMVQVPMNGAPAVNGVNGHANGRTNGHANGHANGSANGAAAAQRPVNPYAPRASDFLSNVCNFKIIESTLRGEPSFLPRVVVGSWNAG